MLKEIRSRGISVRFDGGVRSVKVPTVSFSCRTPAVMHFPVTGLRNESDGNLEEYNKFGKIGSFLNHFSGININFMLVELGLLKLKR